MAKQGMRRYKGDENHRGREGQKTDTIEPVPEIKGKAKHGNKKAKPI